MQSEQEVIDELLTKFTEIATQGWIESHRQHNTGIGKTFEDLLEKVEDNLGEPDYKGIELKTHRKNSNSFTTLFTACPDGPNPSENTRLRETYGEIDTDSGLKTLHTSIFATRKTTYFNKFKFQMEVNYEDKKIYLLVFNMNEELLEKITFWTFDSLNKKLEKKLKILALVDSKSKKENGKELFKYDKITICKFKNFDKFLKAVVDGKIMLDIRIGVYKSGQYFGKTHDHGTGFRIKESDLECLYDIFELRNFEEEEED